MVKRLWCFEALFFLILWLTLAGCFPAMLYRDPGTFWHTAIGLRILDSGRLPTADTFTFTISGKPWASQDWLCQIAMGLLYRIGGWDSLLVATVAVLAVLYAWLAGPLVSAGLAGICAVLVAVVATAASMSQFHLRPLVLTMVLTGLSFALLIDVESGRRPLRQLWWLVPLFLFWTNVHGGVLGGLGTLVLVVGGWLLAAFCGRESPVRSRRDGIELAGILGACTLTLLANPYGLELPRLWFEILRLPLAELILEHFPLWHVGALAVLPIALALLYLLALLGTWPRFPHVTWLMPLVWFWLACSRSRHSALFAIVTVLALADLLPSSRLARWLSGRGFFRVQELTRGGGPLRLGWRRAVLPALVVGLALVLQTTSVRCPVLGHGWARLDPQYWPTQLLPELRELEAQPAGQVRIFNQDLYGGFLIFHTPHLPVFMDDRCELFGEAFLRRYIYLCRDDPSEIDRWTQVGFSHALVRGDSKLERYLIASPRWEPIRRTTTAALFRKTTRQAIPPDACVWTDSGSGIEEDGDGAEMGR